MFRQLISIAVLLQVSQEVAGNLLRRKLPEGGRLLSIEDFGGVADEGTSRWCFDEFIESKSLQVGVSCSDERITGTGNITQAIENTKAFNAALIEARKGDTVLVPRGKRFSFIGGVIAHTKQSITIDLAGSLHFVPDRKAWPYGTSPPSSYDWRGERFDPAIAIYNCTNVTVTSSASNRASVSVDWDENKVHLDDPDINFGGIVNGNGKTWWDDVITGKTKDKRPRLLYVYESANMLIEHLTLINSPYWTLTYECVDSEVRYVNVLVDRKYDGATATSPALESAMERKLSASGIPFPIDDLPDWIGRKFRQPQDLNTDGIDPSGENIWVHDCVIQNADDSVAVKRSNGGRNNTRIPDCTRNITIENMVLTGFGASIGSVPAHPEHSCIDNVVFRNISMPGTGKGIYVKSDWGVGCHNGTGQISNIVYDDVKLYQPFWWAIWVGPQQQHQPHSTLNSHCALTWPIEPHCPVAGCVAIENITFRNIAVYQPLISPAVIMGNTTYPIKNISIYDFNVHESKKKILHGKWPFHEKSYPWHGRFKCQDAEGTYSNTRPIPSCLRSLD